MQKLILLLFLVHFLLSEKPYVLMISFDGFRYDYTDWLDTPNFDYTAKMGVKSESLIPIFPSLTFPNHYSIATGSYSSNHNITGNSFYDKNLNKQFSLYDKNTVKDPRFYKSEPIWITAEKQGVKSASFFWVGSEAPIKGIYPSIFKYYDGSIPFEVRIDSVISWFQLEEVNRPQLILLYFSEPDQTGHKFGLERDKIIESVASMDSLLGYLYNELKKINVFSKLNIIITSDHGMVDVDLDRLIVLDDYIDSIDDLYIYGRGSHVQFDYKKKKKKNNKFFLDGLKKIPHSKCWHKSNIPNRFNFVNNNTGEYLLLADEGWFITTKADLDSKGFSLAGMHGYDPEIKNMHGIFYSMGPKIKSDLILKSFESIHIYPLICDLLNIEPYIEENRPPDWRFEILENIIRRED